MKFRGISPRHAVMLALGVVTVLLGLLGSDAEGSERAALLGIGCIQIVLALLAIRARQDELERIERLTDTALRVHRGESHVPPTLEGGDGIARLDAAVKQLAGDVRQDHREAEAQRILAEAMVRETPNGMVVVDASGRIVSCNPAFLRLVPFGGTVLGTRVADLHSVPDLLSVVDEAQRTQAVADRPTTVGTRDLLVRAMPLANGVGTLLVVLDITSVRLAERARRDFVANVSHELRTPVTALVGYAEALLEDRDLLAPGMAPMVEAISRNAQRLHMLVDDVLQLSKIEARQGDLPLVREAVAPVVRDVIERFEGVARQRSVTLDVEVPEDLVATINADAFDHALGNLVDNAIKYGASGGTVRVRARAEGRTVVVDVEDNGLGIDPVHHPRIFERFYRGDPARSRTIPGTGLGLALVKHLCLAMRAEIRFRSVPGEGSVFSLVLPE